MPIVSKAEKSVPQLLYSQITYMALKSCENQTAKTKDPVCDCLRLGRAHKKAGNVGFRVVHTVTLDQPKTLKPEPPASASKAQILFADPQLRLLMRASVDAMFAACVDVIYQLGGQNQTGTAQLT